jgi:cysteine desulfurase / selenocysteine lyase
MPREFSRTADFAELRRQNPVVNRWAYFDHAAVAALSGPAQTAIARWLKEAAEEGDANWLEWDKGVQGCRVSAAKMVRAIPAEIALVPNTTWGITLVAEGLDWRAGDNVIVVDNEFPSNQYPWLNLASRGVEVRKYSPKDGRIDLAELRNHFDSKTRVLAISWVGYATGWRISVDDVAELTHSFGALLFLDAIQGLGVFPLDVSKTPVDFFAADGHKWLLGPEGAGISYVRGEHLERLRAIGIGWSSVKDRHRFERIDLTLREEAARFEGGTLNMAGFLGLGASIDLLLQHGLGAQQSALAERVLALGDFACEQLTRIGATIMSLRGADCSSGIISFLPPRGEPMAVRAHLKEQGIIVSCRNGWLRMAIHAFNDEGEIGRMVDAVRQCA